MTVATRRWVFDRIRAWLDLDAPQMFAITGPPGSGTTWIAERLVAGNLGDRLVPDVVHFCRWRDDLTTNALRFVERLSLALANRHPAFAAALLAQGEQQIIINSSVSAAHVAAGATVTATRIKSVRIGDMAAQTAFDRAVRRPLEKLFASGFTGSILIVIDAINESLTARGENVAELIASIADAPGELPGRVRIIVTTTTDQRVQHLLGGQEASLDLIDDAPLHLDEVLGEVRGGLGVIRDDRARDRLARRIADRAGGIFLFARHVVAALVADPKLGDLTADGADRIALPEGGLYGVYRDFLNRELARNIGKWHETFGPVLGPLVVARGDGLTTAQLARAARKLTGEPFNETTVRKVILVAYQFLEGPLPRGPFHIFHRSFAEFLSDVNANRDCFVNETDAHQSLVDAYRELEPDQWDEYGWRFAMLHAFRAGMTTNQFASLFELADNGHLERALQRLGSVESISADYEQLFDACSRRHDIGRLARYSTTRASMDVTRKLLTTPGLPGLLLRASPPDRWEATLTECLGAGALIADPVRHAAALINLYEHCPASLQQHPRIVDLPDRVRATLESSIPSSARDEVTARLIHAVCVREPQRAAWANELTIGLSAPHESQACAAVAVAFERSGDRVEAVSALKRGISQLRVQDGDAFEGIIEALRALTSADDVQELARFIPHVPRDSPHWTMVVVLRAACCALADEPEGARAELVQLFGPGADADGFQQAKRVSAAGNVLCMLRDRSTTLELLMQIERDVVAMATQDAVWARAELVGILAALAARGAMTSAVALERISRVWVGEIMLMACSASLQELIVRTAESGAFETWHGIAAGLELCREDDHRAAVAARMIASGAGRCSVDLNPLFDRELCAIRRARWPSERPGGTIALAGAADALGRSGLATELTNEAFEVLRSLRDGDDRTAAFAAIVEALDHIGAGNRVESIVNRLFALAPNIADVDAAVAKVAMKMVGRGPDPFAKLATNVRSALAATRITIPSIAAVAALAETLQLTGDRSNAAMALDLLLRQLRDGGDDRTKWLIGAELAMACRLVGDQAQVDALIGAAGDFEPWCGLRLFRVVGETLTDHTDAIASRAPVFLAMVERERSPTNRGEMLQNLIKGLFPANRVGSALDTFTAAVAALDQLTMERSDAEHITREAVVARTLLACNLPGAEARLIAALALPLETTGEFAELARAMVWSDDRSWLARSSARFDKHENLGVRWFDALAKAVASESGPAGRAIAEHVREALEGRLGNPDPTLAGALTSLGAADVALSEHAAADEQFAHALDMLTRLAGPSPFHYADLLRACPRTSRSFETVVARSIIALEGLPLDLTVALRVSLLESVPLHDLPNPRALILAINPETGNLFTDETQWPRVFAAIAANSASLEVDAATVLRATAWYPPDVHVCALAQLAKAFAMRDARIDGELRTVLLERILN